MIPSVPVKVVGPCSEIPTHAIGGEVTADLICGLHHGACGSPPLSAALPQPLQKSVWCGSAARGWTGGLPGAVLHYTGCYIFS